MKDRGKQSLYASGEDYLEAILVLKKQKGMVRSVDVARHLEVTKPSVSHAVTTLKEGGFLFFTERLIEAGVDPESAEREACRMEHVISQRSFEHLRDAYNSHKED